MSTEHAHTHARQPIQVSQRGRHLVVDIHAHMHVVAAESALRAVMPNLPRGMPFSCPASDAVNAKLFARVGGKLNGVKERLADMDQQGVDVQALSPSPGQYYYFTPPELGRALARAINNGIAEAVASAPDRLVGIGTVPLQDVGMAIEEMRRGVRECNLRGIEISSNVCGRELADSTLRPFFAAAEELGILIFLHPLGFTHGERLAEHYLNNLIGNPLESTLALSHLIFGGVLDAYPGLKLCVAHGGGYLPAYPGRMDHAFRTRDDCRQRISREPSSYLKQIWFDSLVFDRDELDFLVSRYGVDHICMGSDYPFDMGEADPVGFLNRLDETARASILGKNAAMLLNIEARLR
jgi:aminocarboxymuconate-semialdehyde decarboxylase